MKKPFIVANVREIIDGWEHFDPEGYSFSKMVELLNEVADKHFGKNVTEPKEKPEAKKEASDYPCTYCTEYAVIFNDDGLPVCDTHWF